MARKDSTATGSITSYKIADSLFLVRQAIGADKAPAKPVEQPTNHIMAIDCSGSMAYDLPRVREQAKKKLPKLLKADDTLSLIWFSGRGQCGTLLEAEPVSGPADLKQVEQAIDRWLRPVGMTGFKEPLEEVSKLVARIGKKSAVKNYSLMFMSDGCDNQWPRADILKAVESAAGVLTSATFVEYGYYADRPLLTAMAEKSGGTLIFAKDFDQFAPAIEAAIQKKVSGASRAEISISGDAVGGFVYALVDGDLVTYGVTAGKVTVPQDLPELCYLSPTAVGTIDNDLTQIAKSVATNLTMKLAQAEALSPAYAAVSLFAIRMKSDIVYPILKALGDVSFIEEFSGCFGKQRYSAFQEVAKGAAFGKGRFAKGYDPNKVPRDDAFTVLDLLRILSEDDDNRVLLDDPRFNYARIGRGRVDASEILTDEESEEISKLTDEMKSERDAKKIKAITERIAAITATKQEALKFVANKPKAGDEGYSISDLTFNEDRPNVSILVRKTGLVDISARVTAEFKGALPAQFPTHIWRNYAIIKDGLVNVEALPVRITRETAVKLQAAGAPEGTFGAFVAIDKNRAECLIDLKQIPVINRNMVKATSAQVLFTKEWELIKARAAQKVFNSTKKEQFPGKAKGLGEQYGEAAAAWLKEQGFTDNGFNPKAVQAEPTDCYMGKKMEIKLKGFSSIPSLNEYKKQASKGKFNPPGALMTPAYLAIETFQASPAYKNADNPAKAFETWLEAQFKATQAQVRNLIFEMAQIKFAIVVGQVWFTEFTSLDENTLTLDLDQQKIEARVELSEFEIKI